MLVAKHRFDFHYADHLNHHETFGHNQILKPYLELHQQIVIQVSLKFHLISRFRFTPFKTPLKVSTKVHIF